MNEEEDKDWRKRIDSVVLYDRIEELRVRIKELERMVSGGKDSLRSEYRRHDEILTRIYAVLWQDATGQKGFLHDVDVLMGRREGKEKQKDLQWKFWTAIIVAVIASLTTLVTSWDRIQKLLPKDHPGPVEQMIEKAKHPKAKHRHYRYVSPVSANGLANQEPALSQENPNPE